MVTYRWKKYSTTSSEEINWQTYANSTEVSFMDTQTVCTIISFTRSTLKFSFANPLSFPQNLSVGYSYYFNGGNNNAVKWLIKSVSNSSTGTYIANVYTAYPSDVTTVYTKGTYQSDVTSTNRNTYPDNGASGGYWYEYVGIDNTAPTAPGAFTSPTSGLTGGKSSTVTWGTSTDAEGNAITYEVDASFDNGATYSNVYSSSAVSFNYTVPTNKSQVKFRVRAKDSLNAYSGYTYSNNLLINQAPTVTLNTADNATLYENSTFTIDGQAIDVDNGNVVNAKYSIDGIVTKALVAGVSNGVTPLAFNKQLTFKNGKLFDGETSLTGDLAEGTAHQLKVWAEDDQGGKSAEQIRNFYVVPNRVPMLSVDQVTPSGIIDSDKFKISGTCSDPDGNEVAVSYKINGSLAVEIYRGQGSAWSFDVALKDLKVGANAIVVEVTDSYNFKTNKTIKLNKNEVKTPTLQSTVRYKIMPPKSTAKGVLLWIQRENGLSIDAEISMTLNNEQERYVAMSKTNTAPIDSSTQEDEFTYEASEAKESIIVKLKLTRASADVSDAITLISGVLS